jgi:TPR repeat protein
LWERVAETGDFRAAFNAGLYHDHAAEKRDQPANPAKAARFYRIASAKGHVPASTNLGLLLLCRPQLAASLDEGQAFLKLSYDHGDAKLARPLSSWNADSTTL